MLEINKIYCIDALEGLSQLEDSSVDFIFTSPPFKGIEEKNKRRKSISDIPGDYWPWYDKFMVEVSRVVKDYALIFNSSRKLVEIIKRYQTPFRILIWNKGFSQMPFRFEPIFIYQFTDEYSLNRYIWTDVLNASPIPGSLQKVPYENPLKLYSTIIKMLPKDKIILDPFIGSGTTAVACRQLDRNFMGFEINPEYIEIANKRLSKVQIALFN